MARIQKPKSEYEQKLIDLRRVARVMAGGRRFTFRAAMVIGNQRGQVGFGLGKAADTSQAIEKAVRRARQNLISVPLTKDQSIPHEIYAKFGSARVILKPAKSGKGRCSSTPLQRPIDVSAKILSHTKNKLTNALATLEALKKLKTLK